MTKRIPHKEEDLLNGPTPSERLYRPMLDALSTLNAGGRYLEIGCGAGALASMVASRLPHVRIDGLDPSLDAIEKARQHVTEAGHSDRISFIHGSGDDRLLLEERGHYDVVYSTFSVHHWPEVERTLEVAYESLRAGGTLCLLDISRVWWLYFVPSHNGLFESIRAAYTPRELEELLANLGPEASSVTRPFPWFFQLAMTRKPSLEHGLTG